MTLQDKLIPVILGIDRPFRNLYYASDVEEVVQELRERNNRQRNWFSDLTNIPYHTELSIKVGQTLYRVDNDLDELFGVLK